PGDPRGITNVRGETLTMWRTQRPSQGTHEYTSRSGQTLVAEKDASCNGWAHLLTEVFAIHGIRSTIRLVSVDAEKVGAKAPVFHVQTRVGGAVTLSHVGLVIGECEWAAQGSLKAGMQVGPDDMQDAGEFLWKLNVPEDPSAVVWADPDLRRLSQPGHLWKGS